MTETWVVDASPLIVLAKIGAIELLRPLGVTVVVPNAVVAEVLAGPPGDPSREALLAG